MPFVAQLGAKPQTRPRLQLCCARQMRPSSFASLSAVRLLGKHLHPTVRTMHDGNGAENDLLLPAHCCVAWHPAFEFRTPWCERQDVGAGVHPPKNEAMRGPVLHRCTVHPSRIGCNPREPDVCPKILQRSVVCASCVHECKFYASWRAANDNKSSLRRPLTFWKQHRQRKPTSSGYTGAWPRLSHLHTTMSKDGSSARQYSQASSTAGRRDITPQWNHPSAPDKV
jgi:hypothetical protein